MEKPKCIRGPGKKKVVLDFPQKVDYYIREKTKTSCNVGLRNAFSCGYEFAFETALSFADNSI